MLVSLAVVQTIRRFKTECPSAWDAYTRRQFRQMAAGKSWDVRELFYQDWADEDFQIVLDSLPAVLGET
tara:strand:+ start:1197 stop:1403 length:207 start_codon:yes stop_codon:yes gene_type:complete